MEATQRYVADLSGESQSRGGKQEVWYTNRRVKNDQNMRPTGRGRKCYAYVESISRTSGYTKEQNAIIV